MYNMLLTHIRFDIMLSRCQGVKVLLNVKVGKVTFAMAKRNGSILRQVLKGLKRPISPLKILQAHLNFWQEQGSQGTGKN